MLDSPEYPHFLSVLISEAEKAADHGSRMGMYRGAQREMRIMHHLMMNLPTVGTLGIVALMAGPLARLPINLGAWLLARWFDRQLSSEAHPQAEARQHAGGGTDKQRHGE
jgi:hypothetical protein